MMGLDQVCATSIFLLPPPPAYAPSQAVAFIQYGPRWREYRRLTHLAFNAESVKQYEDVQKEHALALLRSLLASPNTFDRQLRL
jgi:cytochrome P450